jgi:phosphoribosylglycinamide formyltransferase 1
MLEADTTKSEPSTSNPIHLGIVASSHGSAFQEVVRILDAVKPGQYRYSVVTDRACGMEAVCKQWSIPHTRIAFTDKANFSKKAQAFFAEQGTPDGILLYFLRLVTSDLFQAYPTFNLHPALLPAFPGLNVLENTMARQPKFFGATLHLVSDALDQGPIVAQTCMPLDPNMTLTRLNTSSFLQKVYLSLLLTQLISSEQLHFPNDFSAFTLPENLPYTDRANPALTDAELLAAFQALEEREDERITV